MRDRKEEAPLKRATSKSRGGPQAAFAGVGEEDAPAAPAS